jgi:CRISPR/Cas system CSM-associated protein Csm3 (group 7 of RAMP superfamily)
MTVEAHSRWPEQQVNELEQQIQQLAEQINREKGDVRCQNLSDARQALKLSLDAVRSAVKREGTETAAARTCVASVIEQHVETVNRQVISLAWRMNQEQDQQRRGALELGRGALARGLDTLNTALHRNPERVAAALGHLVAALEAGEVRLGAAKTRGAGRVRLESGYTLHEDTLDSRKGILDVLKGGGAGLSGHAALTSRVQDFGPKRRPYLTIEIAWKPVGPVMVKADAAGIAVDMLPLVGASNGGRAQVIPGSSIKGTLRAYAERIAATVLDEPDPDRAREQNTMAYLDGRRRFLVQLGRRQLVETLFGAARKPAKKNQQAGGNNSGGAQNGDGRVPLPGLGALTVEDCIAEARIDRKKWRKILAHV